MACTRATASSVRALTVWVAPNFRAKSSAASLTSTATIVVAPGEPRALDDVEAHAAAADHRHAVAGRDAAR